MDNFHQPVRDTAELRHRIGKETALAAGPTGQPQPISGEQPWIERALSWLGTCILEGFAASGEFMCPCLLDVPENYDDRPGEPHRPAPSPLPLQENLRSPPTSLSQEVDIHAWLGSALSRSSQNHRRWFRIAVIWPKRRTVAREPSSCDRLDTPDDRVRRDGSVRRHEIGKVRQGSDSLR